jgi:hypothetical protein
VTPGHQPSARSRFHVREPDIRVYVPGMISRAEAQSFDRVAADYDRLAELAWDQDSIGHWLSGFMPASGRHALDLGCGAGLLSVALAGRFGEIDAIDLPHLGLLTAYCPENAGALTKAPNTLPTGQFIRWTQSCLFSVSQEPQRRAGPAPRTGPGHEGLLRSRLARSCSANYLPSRRDVR